MLQAEVSVKDVGTPSKGAFSFESSYTGMIPHPEFQSPPGVVYFYLGDLQTTRPFRGDGYEQKKQQPKIHQKETIQTTQVGQFQVEAGHCQL